MGAMAYPDCFNRSAIDAADIPFPIPEMTPPETKIYFVLFDLDCVWGTIHYIKQKQSPSRGYFDVLMSYTRPSHEMMQHELLLGATLLDQEG